MAKTDIGKLRGADRRPKDIAGLLETYKDKFQDALPRHLTVDRLLRLALTEVRRVPNLQKADPISLAGAIMRAAQLGLEPGLDCYLIPFFNSKLNNYEVQFLPDYRGLIALARRSGAIGRFEAGVVREGDHFKWQRGTEQFLHHVPVVDSGTMTHAWALAEAKDKTWCQFEVMDKAEIDAIRKRAKASGSGPWVTDYDEMAKKTVARRLTKYLPRSVELADALRADDAAESGASQGNREVIDIDLPDTTYSPPHEATTHDVVGAPSGGDSGDQSLQTQQETEQTEVASASQEDLPPDSQEESDTIAGEDDASDEQEARQEPPPPKPRRKRASKKAPATEDKKPDQYLVTFAKLINNADPGSDSDRGWVESLYDALPEESKAEAKAMMDKIFGDD